METTRGTGEGIKERPHVDEAGCAVSAAWREWTPTWIVGARRDVDAPSPQRAGSAASVVIIGVVA